MHPLDLTFPVAVTLPINGADTNVTACAGTYQYLTLDPSEFQGFGRDYNELCKTEGEHPPTVSNLPFPWHVMTSAPFQATPLPDLHMDAVRAHL